MTFREFRQFIKSRDACPFIIWMFFVSWKRAIPDSLYPRWSTHVLWVLAWMLSRYVINPSIQMTFCMGCSAKKRAIQDQTAMTPQNSLCTRWLTRPIRNYRRVINNKRRPRISAASGTKKLTNAAPPMRRKWHQNWLNVVNCSITTKEFALTAYNFALVIMKFSGFFNRVNFSRNSRFTISLVSVHRKINR